MAESSPESSRRESRRRSQNGLPPSLSSSDSLRRLRCSICVKVFTDPVSTPCGHIFCKSCLNKCWENKQTISCPFCGNTLTQRPDPEINTTENTEVVCDVCEDRKLKAVKSCLVCQSSYCQTHLEPHLRVAGLKKHKLMDPVRNLEDYICQKHDRPLELFCRDDEKCVCPFCLEGDHKEHITVRIEEEIDERKIDVQQKIQEKTKKIEEIKKTAEDRKINSEKEKAAHVEIFTDLIRSIERCQTELLEMMEEQQKAAEKQEEELIEELEQEITELQMRETELEQLSHTEDHLHLLQIYSSLCSTTDSRSLPDINAKTHENLENRRKTLIQLKGNIEEKLEQTLSEELKWVQKHAVDVTLDPDTAHVGLILSKDEKQVRLGEIIQKLPDKPQRFEKCVCVLGKEGFSSGRFYFEVQVKGKTKWDLGVARESVDRKGEIRLCPSNGFWTVWLRKNEYKALASPSVPLSVKVKLQRVGVFVDYEEGLVSFYDVESSSHIYSFTGQTFTDKLYPFFNPCSNIDGNNSDPLIITPLGDNKK
ncbi:E3 ubiquitin-protein ligase TRIM39-like [Danio rerio]|uniref:E3 ubiquitin-protein ligase TRIM39-like n=3 Tax=Danio rerio TaxID=7955 RepID=A0A8M3ASA8_DANRE|nr:E3 ubiquitin-protein ligase TRIM39-like [Danio rerio]|eukprot:XP_009292260.1 E3 ubiquitin-protein ligase TRIM39-like [Danio rerio]